MIDFTPQAYEALCNALISCNIKFELRHDVDQRPDRAIRIAHIEHQKGLKATYYFRRNDIYHSEPAIQQIAQLGHDIGYHYETLAECNGDLSAAYNLFCRDLDFLRRIAPVEKMCAHGSPRSKYDNQKLWRRYNYHTLGITHDSMIDTDFSKTLYLTDTGRCWNGWRYSIRDKVNNMQIIWEDEGLIFHTTENIIQALNTLQHSIHNHSLLINTHPQRWMPVGAGWLAELVLQNIKNQVKRALICIKY